MNIELRTAHQGDLPLMLAWQNNPNINRGFYSRTRPLDWNTHCAWFRKRNSDWRTFLVLYETRPIGVVTIGQLDHWSPEIGYYLGEETLGGQGIGREMVRLGMEEIKLMGKEYCHTTVLKDNMKSIRLLKSLGFKYLGQARLNEIWMQKSL